MPVGVGDGRPQAGEQLLDAERLGDVIVGAGVEGVDLVALGARADSTTMGTSDQPRIPSITSTPSIPGSPRSSNTTSGFDCPAAMSASSPDATSSTS